MPKKIGRYELGRTLGTGNFSKVKMGVDDSGNQWAIKIVDKAQLAKEHMEEQLKREIAVMKMLNHPNVVKLYEVMQTQNNIYLVLELVTGGELFERIVTAKRFDEDTARKFFQQLVVGLYYCHKQGVAHRDLKPENLLLSDKDVLKIMDFGLSNMQKGGVKEQNSGTLLTTVCGTPNYVAPEVLKEQGYNGITADVWSCGVILFVMLAGYLPFDDPNMNALFNKIERGDYRMAKHFSEPVRDLIGKMLIVDPQQRYTLEQVISHPWTQTNFDTAALQRAKTTKVSVSSDEVNGAVGDVAETTKEKKPAQPTAPTDGPRGMDAFDIMSRFTVGSLNPLTAGTMGLVRTATRFLYGGTGTETDVKDIVAVLDQMKANPKTKEGTTEIKGFVNAPKGLLTYVVQIIPLLSGDMCLVEVRRGRGDTFDFHDFFHKLVESLGASVLSKDTAQAAAE
eukprot:PhM_4_TR2067/c4_g1_i2/m.99909